MAFGYRLRSHQNSRVQLEDPPQMAPIAAQQPPSNAPSSSSNHRQHIRLDGLQQQPSTVTGGRQLAGSMLETSSDPPETASFLDDRAIAFDLAQLGRRRRGTTSTVHSTHSTSSAGDSEHGRRPEAAVDVFFKGHLMVKRGLLKSFERRFYFLVRGRAELYACKDETSFNLWLASGWGVNVNTAVAKSSGIAPQLVCTVLRADRAGDSGGSDRGIVVVAQPPPAGAPPTAKAAGLKLYAESPDKCQRWLHALHRVQLTKRASASGEPQDPLSPHSASTGSSKHSSQHSAGGEDVVASPRHRAHKSSTAAPPSSAEAAGPRAYAGGKLRPKSSREDSGSVKSSGSSSDAASEATPGSGHKQREHESTPLESYVEECCQTFLMEATHKANYSEWVSVRQEYFYLQGDGSRVEVRGFGQMQIDSNRMLSLRLFFKTKELFDKLNRESARFAAKAREAQRARGASSAVLHPSPLKKPVAAPAPAALAPTRSKAALTADIIDELANFTIASAGVRTK
ncbi:hypothetical protein PybrP1_006039 [[Pythium] brassicae (nom. inval.)]|nr:hypothetical protein PybrP1_006039 [[Pythium] brassicae (nom. inval.)]